MAEDLTDYLKEMGVKVKYMHSDIKTLEMLLSVDVAHALHPNKKEKMDITNKPVMGKGFCIKQACLEY